MKINKKNIKKNLIANKPRLKELGVTQIGLFGSFIKGEQTKDSDIDFLIMFNPEMESFDNLMKLYDLLEDTFKNRKIDIVTENGLSPFIGPRILEEAEYVNIDE